MFTIRNPRDEEIHNLLTLKEKYGAFSKDVIKSIINKNREFVYLAHNDDIKGFV